MGKTPEAGQPLRSPKPDLARPQASPSASQGATLGLRPPPAVGRSQAGLPGREAQEPQVPQAPGKNSTLVMTAAKIIPVR